MATPEGKVKDDIKKALLHYGFWRAGAATPPAVVNGWYYMPVSNGMGVHGIPDFVCCWYGKFFSIEAKAPGGEPSENQKRRHAEIRAAGGVVLIIDNVELLEEYLNEQGRAKESGVRQSVRVDTGAEKEASNAKRSSPRVRKS